MTMDIKNDLKPAMNLGPAFINGGRITRLNEQGRTKINEARASGTTELPEWLRRDMDDADVDSDQ